MGTNEAKEEEKNRVAVMVFIQMPRLGFLMVLCIIISNDVIGSVNELECICIYVLNIVLFGYCVSYS